MAAEEVCEEFFLHLSSADARSRNPANFVVNLPAPRSLTGRWRMALREITYTQSNKERAYADDEEYIVFAGQDNSTDFQTFMTYLQTNRIARVNQRFTTTSIPGVPYVAVISFFNRSGDPASGLSQSPSGLFSTADEFIKVSNERLNKLYDDWITFAPATST